MASIGLLLPGPILALQDALRAQLHRANSKSWARTRGKYLHPLKLHPAIQRTIREWFELVDDDGSGTLEHHELMSALQVGQRTRYAAVHANSVACMQCAGITPAARHAFPTCFEWHLHAVIPPPQAAQVPCSGESIWEMIELMDAQKRNCIAWDDFER